MVNARGEFGRHTEATVAFIQVAAAFDVLPVVTEGAQIVDVGGRSIGRHGANELVAAFYNHDSRLRILGIGETIAGIDRKAVRGPADQGHGGLAGAELIEETFGHAVVVIGAVGLNVGIVEVDAEVEVGLTERFDLPTAIGVTGEGAIIAGVVAGAGRRGIDLHAVENVTHGAARAAQGCAGASESGRQTETGIHPLLRDRVRVTCVRKGAYLVIRDAVRDECSIRGAGPLGLAGVGQGRLGVKGDVAVVAEHAVRRVRAPRRIAGVVRRVRVARAAVVIAAAGVWAGGARGDARARRSICRRRGPGV